MKASSCRCRTELSEFLARLAILGGGSPCYRVLGQILVLWINQSSLFPNLVPLTYHYIRQAESCGALITDHRLVDMRRSDILLDWLRLLLPFLTRTVSTLAGR